METIFYNGTIITMEESSVPEAVLVREGSIAALGSLEDVKKAAKDPEMFDLDGKCLMPSFIDPHSHILMNGQMSMFARLGTCESHQDIIDVLKAFLAEHDIDESGALLGFGYDHNFLKEGSHPNKRVLDQVSTEIPILILHVSAHLACANSKALELAGITGDTPNPQGGVIGRLEGTMEPSGYLEEAGMGMVQTAVTGRIQPDFQVVMSGMQDNYIQNGVTTIQDGATTENDLNTLKMISAMGQLKIDVVAYPLMSSGGIDLLHQNQDICHKYKNRLKIGGYKLVLDGSPQGRSAWMSKPYLGGDPEYCGYPWLQNETVESYVKTAVEEGQQLLAHCNGDAASEQYLNAYEKAIKETGCHTNLRPVMIHCQTIRNDQLDRMAKINMIASIFVGHVYYWGDVHMKNFGIERGNHISPARDAIDRGVKVNFHQDTPVTPPDMMHSVWCAVNRISRTGKVIGEDQSVSVYEALKAVTIDAAYEYFEENLKGSIKVGKLADLVILDQSPLAVDTMQIKSIKVLRTIKEGVTLYVND
ncbi:MAG: amidohydrolase [Lachnospiraceae bacterium]|nr:amidohydrolase [Lachnospiraceae bacterium]